MFGDQKIRNDYKHRFFVRSASNHPKDRHASTFHSFILYVGLTGYIVAIAALQASDFMWVQPLATASSTDATTVHTDTPVTIATLNYNKLTNVEQL